MKKFSILVISLLLMGLLGGCTAKLDAEKDTVYIQKKGNVTGAIVAKFEKDYYDEKELEAVLTDQITSYNDKSGEDSVKLTEFEVKDEKVRVYIDYKTVDDYAAFNEVILYAGSVSEAQDGGFHFDTVFLDAKSGNAVDSSEVLKNSNYQVVVLEERIDVSVPGSIVFVSENVKLAGDGLAAAVESDDGKNETGDEDKHSKLAYIIFK